jgi:hypothetical protein
LKYFWETDINNITFQIIYSSLCFSAQSQTLWEGTGSHRVLGKWFYWQASGPPPRGRQGVDSLSISRKDCVAQIYVFSSFCLGLIYASLTPEGFCWLLYFMLWSFVC